MIKSMTGFGRCEAADEERKFTVEMKGVNHRYLDANIRMPKKLNFFESAIRSLLKESVHRGKVDIFITYEDFSESQVSLKYNETLAAEYLEKFKMMEEKFSLENDIRVSVIEVIISSITLNTEVEAFYIFDLSFCKQRFCTIFCLVSLKEWLSVFLN